MPIFMMALTALAVFIVIGILCMLALRAEHRQRETEAATGAPKAQAAAQGR